MNPISSVSSRQGISSSPGAGRKDKESTDTTEKLLKSMARGRSVSPTIEGDVPVASARSARRVMTIAAHVPLLGWMSVQDTTSRSVSVMPVDRGDNEKKQLQRELEIIDKLENLWVGSEEKTANKPQNGTGFTMAVNDFRSFLAEGLNLSGQKKKSVNEQQIREMNVTIDEANKLRNDGKLKESDEKLRSVFESVNELGEYNDPSVVSGLCRIKGDILYNMGDPKGALNFLEKSTQFANLINFPDRLFVLYIMAGMDVYEREFWPEIFYKNIKEWLVDDEDNQRKLVEHEKKLPGLTVLIDGIKAVFEEEVADTEESRNLAAKKFEQSITKLDNLAKEGALSKGLINSGFILKFARNLSLIKQSRFQDALAGALVNESDKECEHLNIYIHCQVLAKTGAIDEAIEICEQGVHKGYPLSNYLKNLKWAKSADRCI